MEERPIYQRVHVLCWRERTQVIDYSMPYLHSRDIRHGHPASRYLGTTSFCCIVQLQVWIAFLVSVHFVHVYSRSHIRKQSGQTTSSTLSVQRMPRAGNFRYIELKGSVNAEFLIQSDSPDIRKIGLAVVRNNWFEVLDFGQEIEDNKAIFGSRLLFIILHGKPPFSRVAIAEDGFGIWSVGVMVKKNFCCLERLNTMILRINSAGLYQKFIDDESFERQFYANTNRPSDDGVKKLGLDSFSGIFFLLVILHIASLFVFAAECFYYRRKKKKRI
ncbi:hypothetical protein AVEN_239585-1 [Araneus ventricosus]|uniref:Ionotropic glutamate receptor L-glutamate and glycine-binding domain-containing protein n=1 Tax=Araneus ventricosus TaxID=182803 RepID=A0A4Y2LZH9_ARAVE|nr:hypothetical protein AVEN_239585-1 [Araneus ventricosus]